MHNNIMLYKKVSLSRKFCSDVVSRSGGGGGGGEFVLTHILGSGVPRKRSKPDSVSIPNSDHAAAYFDTLFC